MRYDISKRKAPEMPSLGKGTKCIKLLLKQASKDMYDPSFRYFSPHLAHISATQNFSILTAIGRKYVGEWTHLVGDSGCNKGQLTDLVKVICRDFQQHDNQEFKKLEEWAKLYRSKSKDKPVTAPFGLSE